MPLKILQQLDAYMASLIPSWRSLPLFSKICFIASALGLVLYVGLVIRGRLFGGDEKGK
jgi:hypothetical protein